MAKVMLATSTWVSDLCFSLANQNGKKIQQKWSREEGEEEEKGVKGCQCYFCSTKASQSPGTLQSLPWEGLVEPQQHPEVGR